MTIKKTESTQPEPSKTKRINKPGGGRPEFKFDYKTLEEVCRLHPTDDEIAAFFGITRKTVANHKNERRFVEARARGEAVAKTCLRRWQWQSAEGEKPEVIYDKFDQPVMRMDKNGHSYPAMTEGREPNITMQIWLGKNLLGQTDKQEITGADAGPMVIKVVYEKPCLPSA